MLNRFLFALVAVAAMAASPVGASANSRFALVIGNSNYQSVTALPNPVKDAEAIAGLLEKAGFDVTSALDLAQDEMRQAVRDFAVKLVDEDEDSVALIYFAGHGVQIDGENYLLPVDASIARESDVALEGVRLADLMNMLDAASSKTRIVILDACRNNPFEEIAEETGRGLAIVNAPAGSVVAYSTSPGATAEDGSGDNSPFTAALVEAAQEPGVGLETVFKNVRLAVHKDTKGRQTPWEVTALTRPFWFFPGADGAAQPEPEPEKSADEWRRELHSYSPGEAYDIVVQQNVVVVYEIFLALYPDSQLSRRIRSLMERRLEMEAWFATVTLNTVEAFETFLKRYPDSDLAPTAEKLSERARQRALLVSAMPGARGIEPAVRTITNEVVREVKVPVEVIKEVKVPVEKIVTKEVIKEVPVVKIKEVIKEVKVPVVKEKIVRVPVEKVVVKEKIVRVPSPPKVITRTKTVRVPVKTPCNCRESGRRQGGSSGGALRINPRQIPF